jgi:hypothetical protein
LLLSAIHQPGNGLDGHVFKVVSMRHSRMRSWALSSSRKKSD